MMAMMMSDIAFVMTVFEQLPARLSKRRRTIQVALQSSNEVHAENRFEIFDIFGLADEP